MYINLPVSESFEDKHHNLFLVNNVTIGELYHEDLLRHPRGRVLGDQPHSAAAAPGPLTVGLASRAGADGGQRS